jgi:hypothetical protein
MTAELHRPSATVEAHWQRLRGTRPAPSRLEWDPAMVVLALPVLTIVEVPSLRVRVSGSVVDAWFRPDNDLLAGFLAEDRERVRSIVPRLQRAEVVRIDARSPAGRRCRLACFPLTLGRGEIERAIVAVDGAPPFGRGEGMLLAPALTLVPARRSLTVIQGGLA